MAYEWDEAKRQANIAKHGVDFTEAGTFQWPTAVTRNDRRRPYPEPRMESLGLIGSRLDVLVWTEPQPGVIRVISLRKANPRERKRYVRDYDA